MRRPLHLHALLALPALAFVACGGGSGSQTPPPAPPTVSGFTASTARIVQGDSATLTATFTGGTAVLAPGGLALQSGVPVTVSPAATTTYTVTVTGAGGTASATAKVGVESFTPVGSMGTPRLGATATLLPNGKVLVAGGTTGSVTEGGLRTAELYDPATRTFSPTGNMVLPRVHHQAVLLPDGKVLLAGGAGSKPYCETYDPAAGTFTLSAPTSVSRSHFTAVPLKDGRVLLALGYGRGNTLTTTVEAFDPATGTVSPFGFSSWRGTAKHAAVTRPDGTVLLLGGTMGRTFYRIAPDGTVTDHSKETDLPNVAYAKAFLKQDGSLLIPGGGDAAAPLASVRSMDTATYQSAEVAVLGGARTSYAAVTLDGQRVLLAGGFSGGVSGQALDRAEIMDAATGQCRPTAKQAEPRNLPVLVRLADGRILMLGGSSKALPGEGGSPEGDLRVGAAATPDPAILATAELFDPGN